MKKMLLALFLAAVTGELSAAYADQHSADFEKSYLQWLAAFDKGDGATMDRMEVPDLIVVNTDGSGNIRKKTGPRGNFQGQNVTSHTLSNVTVRQYGDTAILTALDTGKVTGSPDDAAATTVVWVRQSGKWLIAVAQWSAVPTNK